MPPARMIGRGASRLALQNALAQGQHKILAGPRRTGKTTLCEAALEKLRGKRLYVAEANLFQASDLGELSAALMGSAAANRRPVHKVLRRIAEGGRAVLDRAGMRIVTRFTGEFGEETEVVFERKLAARRDGLALFDAALRLCQRIADADGKQIVVFFDEFQEIAGKDARYGDPDVLTKRMRAILERSPRVTCLLAGSVEHMMRDLFTPTRRALHGFGTFFEPAPIEPAAWRRGIAERFAEDGCTIDATALDRLVELGSGHPRATMLLAQQAHALSVGLGEREIDSAMVAQAYEEALDSDRMLHLETVARIRDHRRTGAAAIEVAKRIARDTGPYASMEPKAAQRGLEVLEELGIAVRTGPRNWRIDDPLLATFLNQFEPM